MVGHEWGVLGTSGECWARVGSAGHEWGVLHTTVIIIIIIIIIKGHSLKSMPPASDEHAKLKT